MGILENSNDKLFVESITMIGLSIVGIFSLMGNPSLPRVYIYKLVAFFSFLICGGYMLFTMFIMILKIIMNSGPFRGQDQEETKTSIMLTYIICFVGTLGLLAAAVSSRALYVSIEAQEEILKLMRYTIGLS